MPFPLFPNDAEGIDVAHDPKAERFLRAVQGNILKGHGRNKAYFIFFRFGPSRSLNLNMLAEAVAKGWVSSAWSQWETSLKYKPTDLKYRADKPFTPLQEKMLLHISTLRFGSLALTRWGLAALGCVGTDGSAPPVGDFSYRQSPTSFSTGLRQMLSPAAQMPAHFTEHWQKAYSDAEDRAIHGMFLLACDNEKALEEHRTDLLVWLSRFGIACVHIETGTTWRHNGRTNREAFGFVDGISMPRFFANERRSRHPRDWEWVDLKLSDAFITPEQSEVHAGGSYMVFLKFEQNVRAYRAHEEKIKSLLRMGEEGYHYAPALHVGRLRDGCPLHHAWKLPLPPESEFNRFDYGAPAEGEAATTGCPFHAHIRKMNPRVDDRDGAGDRERIIRSQPIRRGMLYDDRGELRRRGRGRGKPWPNDGCGLLFIAYMNDLTRQFERLHNDWALDPNFPNPGNGQLDGILEAGSSSWEWRGTPMPPIERFVKRLGGHYFYVPSIPWLENRGYFSS